MNRYMIYDYYRLPTVWLYDPVKKSSLWFWLSLRLFISQGVLFGASNKADVNKIFNIVMLNTSQKPGITQKKLWKNITPFKLTHIESWINLFLELIKLIYLSSRSIYTNRLFQNLDIVENIVFWCFCYVEGRLRLNGWLRSLIIIVLRKIIWNWLNNPKEVIIVNLRKLL